MVLVALLGITHLLGGLSAKPEIASELGTCDGALCALGLIPGKTSWSAIQGYAATRPGDVDVSDINIRIRTRSLVYVSFLSPAYYGDKSPESPVPMIELYFLGTARPVFLDWLADYGPPCCVTLNPSVTLLDFEYPTARISLANVIPMSSLQPSSDLRIDHIALYPAQSNLCEAMELSKWVKTWHGLITPQRYFASVP